MLKRMLMVLALLSVWTACGERVIVLPQEKDAYDIGKDFENADAWKQKGAEFVKKHEVNLFQFLEKGKEDAANAIRQGLVKFHGLEVYETRIWFDANGVSRMELSLFNKGDSRKPLESSELLEILKTVREKLTPEGMKAPSPESTSVGNGVLQKSMTWKTREPAAAQLTWRYKKIKGGADADFVRLTLVNAAGGAAAVKEALTAKKATQGRGSIKKNVVKVSSETESNAKAKVGDVFIDNVPMVDQGQKGYCAVATSERVLRYYGHNVDEHEIGASAGTSAAGGTSMSSMFEAVKKIGGKYGLNTNLVYGDFNKGMDTQVEKFLKEIENYNKMAKKMKKSELKRSDYARGSTIDANAAREAMDAEVLKAMKLKNPKFKNFQKALHEQVNAGVPLFWGVTLGLFPEPDIPQASGGHMRLIIGYNDSAKEIVYTDTWGPGHEYKRMSFDNAWAITDALLFLKPSRE